MKFLNQFLLYTYVGLLNAGISFLLMPYISHHIDPAGNGILSMVNSLVTIYIPLMGITAAGLIIIEYYNEKDTAKFASLFSTILAIPIIPAIVLVIGSVVFSGHISAFLEIPPYKTYWVPIGAVIAWLTIYVEILFSYIIVEQKPFLYAKFSIIKFLVEISLTVIFISVFKMSWEGRLLSWLITTILFFIISFWYFFKRKLITFNLQRIYVRAGINFGLPLVLYAIGKFINNQSDRIFIAKLVTIDEAGIYNIGYQFGLIILVLVTAIGNFYPPFLYERLSNRTKEGDLAIVKTVYISIIGLFFATICLYLIAPLIFKFMIDPSYSKGIIYVFWTGLSYFFWGVYVLFSGFIFYTKKTKLLGYMAILNIILNITLNYFLIKQIGTLGAVYATCISFFIVACVIVLYGGSIFKLPWGNLKEIFSYNKKS